MLHEPHSRQRALKQAVVALAVLASACKSTPAPPPEVDRAVAYFVARGDQVDPISVLFLEQVRRRHGLKGLEPVVAHLKNPRLDLPHPDRDLAFHLKTYARIADPAAAPAAAELAKAFHPFDILALETMYCDRNGAGVNLDGRLRELADAPGGYTLTHAAMYTAWGIENGCLDEKPGRALLNELGDKLVALVGKEGGPTDLGLEAMAMLLATGQRAKVKPEWIGQVKKFQRQDGGWTHGPVGPTNDHSSLLGLWVLIEDARPDAKPMTWFKS